VSAVAHNRDGWTTDDRAVIDNHRTITTTRRRGDNCMWNSKCIVGLAFILLMTGCATVEPSSWQLATADYGRRPSDAEAMKVVKSYMHPRLIDPYSAVYECERPRKAWTNLKVFFSDNISYGYAMRCNINAKNRLGGYTGAESYRFMIHMGRGGVTNIWWDEVHYVAD
jgi:hypothetical protein